MLYKIKISVIYKYHQYITNIHQYPLLYQKSIYTIYITISKFSIIAIRYLSSSLPTSPVILNRSEQFLIWPHLLSIING